MATIDNLFDSGRGRLGNLVFYRMNGMNIVRTKPAHFHDSKSPAQLAQRQRMKVVNDFLKPFLQLIRITFPPQKAGRTARSESQSYIMRHALAGEYPGMYVDKSKALLSRGPLPVPVSAKVTAHPDGVLIEWENGSEAAGPRVHDTLLVVAQDAKTGSANYRFTEARRADGRYVWKPVPASGQVAVWIAFRNQAQTEMSDSLYVGEKVV